MTFVRNLDLVLLALALPVFIVAGLPFLGWLTGAVVWALWRIIGEWSERRAAAAGSAGDLRKMAGITAGSMIGRGWLLGLILLGVGLGTGDDEVGLSAALLALALFTVYFTFKLILRPTEPHGPRTT
jgi:hypothetical protein